MKNNFRNKKVVVMGLGLNNGGVGAAKFFAKQEANVLVTDLKPKKELKESLMKLKGLNIEFVLGRHREKDFREADLIIKNPAVCSNSKFLKLNKNIKTDIQIFFELFKGEIIGITGTKGKSTTAALIYKLLKGKYPKIKLAGNIGVSPLKFLGKTDIIVLELSSFALEDLRQSPHVAVITNIFEDHLNRYKNFKEYINSKKPIFKYQNKEDVLFLNKDDKYVKAFAKEAKGRVIFFKEEEAARAVANYYKIKNVEKTISSFKGIPHRQEVIGTKKGIKYINDTAATTPESVIRALNKFKNVILITGGEDKNLNYRNLAEEIEKKVKYSILLPGTATDKLLKRAKPSFARFTRVKSMEEAVKKAVSLAERGDTILLSPGAASFGLFKNEFDRGSQFKKYAKENWD